MYVRTVNGLEVHTVSENSDSFTLYDGDSVAVDFLNGDEVDGAALKYRCDQVDVSQL